MLFVNRRTFGVPKPSHPKFKFSWLKTDNEKKYARERLNARLTNFVEIHSAKDIGGSEDDPLNFDGDVSPHQRRRRFIHL